MCSRDWRNRIIAILIFLSRISVVVVVIIVVNISVAPLVIILKRERENARDYNVRHRKRQLTPATTFYNERVKPARCSSFDDVRIYIGTLVCFVSYTKHQQ